jgi:hypothetical protein
MSLDYPTLEYRGNFHVKCGIDHAGALLSAEYAGGYREDVVVGVPLRDWSLTYSALINRAMITLEGGAPIDRASYVWNFYNESKDNGNRPFRMRCPRDGKFYLCFFPQDRMEFEMVNRRLSTTGLQIKQVYVRGVSTLDDGSLSDDVINPDEI